MKILDKDGNSVKKLDLGIVSVGESKEYKYYLLNDSGTLVKNIEVELSDNNRGELDLLDFPKRLSNKSRGVIKLKWKPDMKVKKGLKVKIKVKGDELWGAV